MSKVNFTTSRIDAFKCPPGKCQFFLWDAKSPGLGLRATEGGAKSYIFQGKIHGQTLRITIGDTRSWTIELAQEESRRLQRLIDSGIDPRIHKTEQENIAKAKASEVNRKNISFGTAWDCYIKERRPKWSERHYEDHVTLSAEGNKDYRRGQGLTRAGPLADLRPIKLTDLDSELLGTWLAKHNVERPTVAALAYRLLRAFIGWTHDTPEYKNLIPANAISSRLVKDQLSKPKAKEGDCLQREQLAAWFKAVRTLGNPVHSAYLQGLLITGARREELAALKWVEIDFKWRTLSLGDKVDTENGRLIPLTPYFASLLKQLKELNEIQPSARKLARLQEAGKEWAPSEWVFFSETSADGKIAEPRIAHNRALELAELPHLTIHGLRRSFGTLAEWVECPTGVVAQIMGHRPSAIAEKHYRRRPIDLLRMWHDKIENWMLEQANID